MNERYGSSFQTQMLRYFYNFESDISLVTAYMPFGPKILPWMALQKLGDPNRW